MQRAPKQKHRAIAVGAVGCFEACSYQENVPKGTTAKAQGTTAIPVGAVGYFEATHLPGPETA